MEPWARGQNAGRAIPSADVDMDYDRNHGAKPRYWPLMRIKGCSTTGGQ